MIALDLVSPTLAPYDFGSSSHGLVLSNDRYSLSKGYTKIRTGGALFKDENTLLIRDDRYNICIRAEWGRWPKDMDASKLAAFFDSLLMEICVNPVQMNRVFAHIYIAGVLSGADQAREEISKAFRAFTDLIRG